MTEQPVDRYIARFFRKLGEPFYGDVLDLGCGDGRLAEYLASHADSVLAIDLEEHPRWQMVRMPNVKFQVGNAEQLDLRDAGFDTVLSVNMLHHTTSPLRALQEMARVRKPAGRVIVVEPNRYNPLGYVHLTLMGNHQHFPTRRFLQLVRQVFPHIEHRQFECHCYPLPLPLLLPLEFVEDRLDKLPPWRPFVFYNVAVG